MSKQDILEIFYTTSRDLTPARMVIVLLVALAASLAVYIVYYLTSDKELYNRSFNEGNVLLTLITSVIMMMISSNVAISLGMVGALSIIRFRTAVKNARDTLFFFWSMVLGLCAGSQNFVLCIVSVVFIAVVVFAFKLTSGKVLGYTLIVRAGTDISSAVNDVLSSKTFRCRLVSASRKKNSVEYVYSFNSKPAEALDISRAVSEMQDVEVANLVDAGY